MTVNITANLLKYLQKEGVGLESYILLLAIAEGNDVFDEANDVKIYIKCQKLIIFGLLTELFGNEPELFQITDKGLEFLETLQKLTENE